MRKIDNASQRTTYYGNGACELSSITEISERTCQPLDRFADNIQNLSRAWFLACLGSICYVEKFTQFSPANRHVSAIVAGIAAILFLFAASNAASSRAAWNSPEKLLLQCFFPAQRAAYHQKACGEMLGPLLFAFLILGGSVVVLFAKIDQRPIAQNQSRPANSTPAASKPPVDPKDLIVITEFGSASEAEKPKEEKPEYKPPKLNEPTIYTPTNFNPPGPVKPIPVTVDLDTSTRPPDFQGWQAYADELGSPIEVTEYRGGKLSSESIPPPAPPSPGDTSKYTVNRNLTSVPAASKPPASAPAQHYSWSTPQRGYRTVRRVYRRVEIDD